MTDSDNRGNDADDLLEEYANDREVIDESDTSWDESDDGGAEPEAFDSGDVDSTGTGTDDLDGTDSDFVGVSADGLGSAEEQNLEVDEIFDEDDNPADYQDPEGSDQTEDLDEDELLEERSENFDEE